MSKCSICGKEIPADDPHMVYAFVGGGLGDIEAMELCKEHTERLVSGLNHVQARFREDERNTKLSDYIKEGWVDGPR